MAIPIKMKYPNLPDDFPDLVRERRLRLGITQTQMAKDFGVPVATIGQFETRKRNFNYERAKQFVEYLNMDYELPEPDLTQRQTITRQRSSYPVHSEPFFVEVDGKIIHVLTYRKLGPILKGVRTKI